MSKLSPEAEAERQEAAGEVPRYRGLTLADQLQFWEWWHSEQNELHLINMVEHSPTMSWLHANYRRTHFNIEKFNTGEARDELIAKLRQAALDGWRRISGLKYHPDYGTRRRRMRG